MNILHLKSIQAIDVEENTSGYLITAKEVPTSIACSHCGAVDFQKFGNKAYTFKDIPIHGKPVDILLHRKRYRCKSCRGTFFAYIEDLNDKRRCTNRLISYVKEESEVRSFVSIAKSVGVGETTIRDILKD